MPRRTFGIGLVAVLAVGALVVLFAFPRWFSLITLVIAVLPLQWQQRRPRNRPLARVASEALLHMTVEMGIRGLLLVWSAAALSSSLAAAAGLFYAVLLTGSRLLPRLIDRLTGARLLVASLPGAELQDEMDLFSSVSRPGAKIRKKIRQLTNWLEVPAVAVVVASAFGWAPRDARWGLIALAAVAAITLLIETVTLVSSLAGRTNRRFHEQVSAAVRDYRPTSSCTSVPPHRRSTRSASGCRT